MRIPSLKESVDWLAAAVAGVGVLAVTNRRWSPALLASALGMGLFVGVAFGPASDSLNALTSQVVAVDGGAEEEPAPVASGGGGTGGASSGGGGGGGSSATVTPSVTPTALPSVTPTPVTDPLPEDPVDDGDGDGDIPPTNDPPPEEESSDFVVDGTVVYVNPAAGSYALAVRGEQLYVVHAKKLPGTGDQVEVPLVELANQTYGEDGSRELTGSSKSAEVAGFVSYVSPEGETPTYTVSTLGASLPIVFQASEASPDLPKRGEFVTADVTIGDPPEVETDDAEEAEPAGECARTEPVEVTEPEAELVEKGREADGEPSTYFDLAGTVQAICPATSQLLLSSDSTRQSGSDVTIEVPDDIDLGRLDVDQAVLALAEVAEDGSLSLAGIASDDGEKGADDDKQLQGDFG